MQSLEVIHLERAGRFVIQAAHTHHDAIVGGLLAKLTPALAEGEPVPDVGFPIRLGARLLESALTKLLLADQAHLQEEGDDGPFRAKRDTRAAALYDEVVQVREGVAAIYGDTASQDLGLTGRTPVDPTQLLHFARYFVERAPKVTLPPPRIRGVSLDLSTFTARINAGCRSLHEALQDVTREAHEASATQVKKHEAIATFEAQYADTANFLSAMLSLAGLAELADRVRYQRRAASSSEAADEAVIPTSSPAGEVAATSPA